MNDPVVYDRHFISHLTWLIRLRWLAAAGMLLAVWGVDLFLTVTGRPARLPGQAMVIALAILVYNLLLWTGIRSLRARIDASPVAQSGRRLLALAYAQIGVDLVALAVVIHLAGGVENPFAFLFLLHIILAGILLGPAVSYLAAGGAWLLYAAITGLEYAGVLRHYHLPIVTADLYHEPLYVLTANIALGFTIFAAAYLTTTITARLRQRDRELEAAVAASEAKSRELAAVNEQMREAEAERTRFMTLVTHELRSPLSIIYTALDVILAGYASPEQAHDVMTQTQNRAGELLELVDDLLELTRARDESHHRREPVATHPAGPLRDVVDFFRVEADRKGLALSVDVAPDLPLVQASAEEMKLVWTNLLGNAFKYTPSGGMAHVSLGYTWEYVVGTVEDSGIGIAPEDQPRIFDEFFRAKNARQASTRGTGVGLAVVRRIVDNCGGNIKVDSVLNQGTKFTFCLPRADTKRDTA